MAMVLLVLLENSENGLTNAYRERLWSHDRGEIGRVEVIQ